MRREPPRSEPVASHACQHTRAYVQEHTICSSQSPILEHRQLAPSIRGACNNRVYIAVTFHHID